MSDIADLLDTADATSVAQSIRSGAVSATEVVKAAIARCEALDPTLNALVDTCFEQALAAAAAVDPSLPFAGVPFLVKDLGQEVAGLRHTRGSRLFADAVADADSELVRRYRAAGFIILGTTNSPELGKNASTEPVLHGATRNPHNLDHSPGGSSGGAAAAVAAGMVPVAHASDGGGSIRIPAAACGLFGLKPSRGRVTSYPSPSLLAYPLGIDHVVTRSVRDSAAILDHTAGPMVGDPYQLGTPAQPWLASVGAPLDRLRIAFTTTLPTGDAAHEETAAATRQVADMVESMGHQVSEAAPNYPLESVSFVRRTMAGVPTALTVDRRLAELGRELQDDDLEPFSRAMYDRAAGITGTEVVDAMQQLETIAQTVGAFWGDHDLLVTPTMAQPVAPLGLLDTTNVSQMYEHIGGYAGFTSPFNLTGQPAVSVPWGTDGNGLPIGVQLVAAYGREDLLFAASAALEAAAPWPTRAVAIG